jgi:hypothetical protein
MMHGHDIFILPIQNYLVSADFEIDPLSFGFKKWHQKVVDDQPVACLFTSKVKSKQPTITNHELLHHEQ